MEKQMTAVEWLEKQFGYIDLPRKLIFDQAKEMEKKQICDFYEWLKKYYYQIQKPERRYIDELVEQYYAETFKSK